MGDQHISLGYDNRLPLSADTVLAATGKDGPCVLTFRMHMSRDALAGLDVPGNDRCVSRFGDDRANGLTIGWLEEFYDFEEALRSHCRLEEFELSDCEQEARRSGSIGGLTTPSSATAEGGAACAERWLG